MIQPNYYIIAGISILSLLVILLHLKENDLLAKKTVKQLKFIACFIIAEIIVDTIFKTLEGNLNVASTTLYLIKAFEFLMNPILPFLILRLFSINNTLKRFQIIQLTLIIVNAILQIASLFGKFMFYIDENNIYQRTSLTIVYAISIVASVGNFVLAIILFSHNIQNMNILTLCGFCIIFATGFILRFFFINTNYDWLCVSITFFIIVIYYSNLTLKLDPLTRLLNRQVYSNLIQRINFTTLIIIIDANNFKQINDTYGHECGDQTLKLIAKCIYKAYGEYGYCFRIGGDEFCVILKPNVLKKLASRTPNSDLYATAKNLMKNLDEIIQSRCASKDNTSNYLRFGVSQGYGVYYSHSEYPCIENNLSIDKVIQIADKRMYKRKAKLKKKFSNNIPEHNQETKK